mmetsp:Transcript_104268/g.185314  ORF Transcript_104268/g.185314 Transcript_104268/m.185314 type:complete len:1286 (-) Transcript_104268:252-4109(-)|eukprot:CAMPEP_0197620148 /NCGR_PEP_ID=MMETSP1338-20131121/1014_1 /TAXON_ID=43686 ORGANISM="Pelagodinium beii, Strain RCC1491" /NCGR_SAMPLE_ID=MMETSP1338 /ASSEMBLY_ACC=CAM_ASM_000754 /LENGTH=1285 /DNA_ID=CAMNT_0043189243 /DNA_START=77 /DNA_END=3934 /DNA_ORIENTATION=+
MASPTLLGNSTDAKMTDDDMEEINDGNLDGMIQNQETSEADAAQAKADALKEFGGPVSVATLLSLASCREKAVFAFGILGAAVHGAGQPLLCLMFGDLIDSLTPPKDLDPSAVALDPAAANDMLFDNVGQTALTFVLIGFGALVAASIQGACFPWFAESQMAKMRPFYLDAMLHRDVAWFDTHGVGALADEMGSDLETYVDAFGTKLGVSIMSASGVVIGLIVAFTLSWEVSLLMLVTFPLMGFGALIMAKAMQDMQQETQGAYAKAAEMADEVLFAIRTVVSFSGEARELTRYTAATEIARKGGMSNRVKQGVGMGYVWLIYFASMALAFWFAMTLVYNDVEAELTVGNLMSCFFCVLTVGFTVGQIAPGFAGIVSAKISMARFFYIFNHESTIQRRVIEDRKEMGPIEDMSLQNVVFFYPARPEVKILDGLNLTIRKGQKVAVVGESGSGKSTVMALLERFYDPSEGKVLVNMEDLRNFSVSSYRKQIGYVGQEPVLFATSARANIMMGCPGATEADFQRATADAQLDFIEALPGKFETYVGSGGSQFSGGQKQRIAIARALLKKPSVLFLDEATSALDSASERMIQATIDEIGEKSSQSMTIVTIAHRLSTVSNSDVIYVLKSGQVVESGSHAELTAMEGGLYQALAAAQQVAGLESPVTDPKKQQDKQLERHGSGASKAEEEAEFARMKSIQESYKVPTGRLLEFCKAEWWCFVPGFLAALISGACFPVLGAFVLVDAMEAMLQDDKETMKEEVEKAAIFFTIVGAAKFVATAVQASTFGKIAEATTKECRVRLLKAMLRQEIGYHDDPQHTPGQLVTALRINAYRISNLMVSLGDKADAVCSVLVGMTLAFLACWEMAAAMLLSIPIFSIAQVIQMSVIMGSGQTESESLKAANQVLADSLMNARTVQAAGNEKDVLALYSDLVGTITSGSTRRNVLGGMSFGFANAVVFWICAAGFWFMGFLIKEGRTNFGDGQRAFMGILYAGMGAGMAFALTGDLGKAKVATHDVFEILDRETLINGLEPNGHAVAVQDAGRIEFDDVKFTYPFRPEVKVLKGVSFSLKAGQSAGVVGPSGGGKSTVLALIQRFYDPQMGSVFIGHDRISLRDTNIRWWRKQIGFVGQEPILFNTTVLENVKYGLEDDEEISSEHLEKCKQMANLNFLDSNRTQGWQTQVGPRGGRLSGGQKQRVAICRALLRNPAVLLLDEATSALDSQSEHLVQAALEAARKDRTSIAIAHRLSTIQDCDVIIVVAEGRVVESGTHEELLNLRGVYFKLQLGQKK